MLNTSNANIHFVKTKMCLIISLFTSSICVRDLTVGWLQTFNYLSLLSLSLPGLVRDLLVISLILGFFAKVLGFSSATAICFLED